MQKNIKKLATPYGLALGAALSILTLLAYFIQWDWFTSTWFSPLKLVFVFLIAIFGVYQGRRQNSKNFSFRQAFSTYFMIVVVGTALYTVVSYFLFDLIDHEAGGYITEKSIETFRRISETSGQDAEKIKQQITVMREEDQFSILNQLKGFVFNLAIYAIAGLLIALIFRSQKPIHR